MHARQTEQTLVSGIPGYIAGFRKSFPDFHCDFPIYLMISLGHMDGAGRVVGASPALVLGVEMTDRIETPAQMPVFFTHELWSLSHLTRIRLPYACFMRNWSQGDLMRYRLRISTIFAAGLAINGLCLNPAHAQESRWAAAGDPTAKALIDWERQWAEAGCTHNGIEKTILAEDFLGTSPHGSLYTKEGSLTHSPKEKPEEACTLYEVKVHFFGDSMDILYGSESAIHIEADGRRHRVKLTNHMNRRANNCWRAVIVIC